jgi:energy-coupling factor transport system permease protein
LVAAVAVTAAAVVLGGFGAPLLLVLVGVLAPALAAGVMRSLVRTVVLLTLPLAISILLVNLFFYPGGQSVLVRIGPIVATVEGLRFALEILVRLAAIGGAIVLFYLTTRPGDLVIDLEGRGVPARLAFVANASVQTVPAMVDRAAEIAAAQRARGLETEGRVWARLRGIVPLVGPVILGSIAEVEERTMALEARGFTRPGPRTLLWQPADSGRQALARWLLAGAIPLLILARAVGWLAWLG